MTISSVYNHQQDVLCTLINKMRKQCVNVYVICTKAKIKVWVTSVTELFKQH